MTPISAATTVVGVMGKPVAHSLSPAIHNAAFAELGVDWVSLGFEVDDDGGPDAMVAMRTMGLRGLSVTMPHKATIISSLDELAPSAAALGVANCVSHVDGRLIGHNTDGDGFVAALADDAQLDLTDLPVVILGAGGAARSIVEALGRAGASDIAIVNRTVDKAHDCAGLAPTARAIATTDTEAAAGALQRAHVVVNTTSVGMGGTDAAGASPLDGLVHVESLTAAALIVDIIYKPERTPLLDAAGAAGLATMNGLAMLVHQAVEQLEIWTGTRPAAAPLMAAAQAVLDQRR